MKGWVAIVKIGISYTMIMPYGLETFSSIPVSQFDGDFKSTLLQKSVDTQFIDEVKGRHVSRIENASRVPMTAKRVGIFDSGLEEYPRQGESLSLFLSPSMLHISVEMWTRNFEWR